MSTPQTPPQTPPPPVDSDAAAAHVEPHDASANAASNGAPGKADEVHAGEGVGRADAPPAPEGAAASAPAEDRGAEASAEQGADAGAEHEGADAGAEHEGADANTEHEGAEASEGAEHQGGAPAAAGEKKRRRRRRRKKSGAQAGGEEGSAEHPEQAADAVTAEGSGEPGADVATEGAEHEKEGAGAQAPARGPQRDKKKEKKHGPSRERPLVTVGDIIFGKILQITDEAIFIDIPGKAHAIFDRGEMMLPEDDEQARPAPAVTAPTPAPEATPAADAQPAAGLPLDGQAAASVDAAPAGATSPSSEPVDASIVAAPSDGAAQATQEVERATEAAPEEPSGVERPATASPAPAIPADPPREPKVPRVILEVGADFIGVVHNDGMRGGLVVLTHHPRRAERTKASVEKAFQDKTPTLGLVTGVIKGGIEVDVEGLRAFAPGSHVDLHMGADLSYLLGKRLPFLVTQYAKRGRDVVLSRKSVIEEDARKARTDALARLKVGEDLDGVVRSVVPFGAFVDVGGIEGLVPLQEMSHNRADGPSDVFKAGEPTRVRVVKVDDRGKVWLSRRATIPDPWQQVAQKYAQGTRHTGKVVRLQPFGAFIELEPGVDGLVHTQDLSIKRIEGPGDVVKVGDTLEVVVANVDPINHKIALHPAPTGDMANEAPQRVAPHKPVKARVIAIESGGLVVRLLGVTGRNARGYVTSAGTGTPRGTELRKAFSVGQEVDAKVVEVDPRRGEVKLSIKALSEDQERNAYQQYRQQLKAEARFTLADQLTKKSSPR